MAMNFFRSKLIPKDHIAYVYDLVLNIIAPGNHAFVSPEIQKNIDIILNESLPNGWRDNPSIVKEILRSLKKGFSYDQKYFPEYYAAYYLPNNLYKVQLMFLELFRLGKISFSEKKLMVLDIGSSIGTTAWALQDFYDILMNVLKLYGLNEEELPPMEIDSIEKVSNNIKFFNKIRARYHDTLSKVQVNEPILGDVLKGALEKIPLNKYDVIFASNVICEFPGYQEQKEFVEKIISSQKNKSAFIIIETAKQSDTVPLKKIQCELSKKKDIHIVSPCGKISKHSERCSKCWSFRKEKLRKPKTMELFSLEDKTEEDDEKLKWSYTLLSNC